MKDAASRSQCTASVTRAKQGDTAGDARHAGSRRRGVGGSAGRGWRICVFCRLQDCLHPSRARRATPHPPTHACQRTPAFAHTPPEGPMAFVAMSCRVRVRFSW
eukprot:4948675-Prymnesium_polylepis.1